MKKEFDCCQFVREMERNPLKKVSRLSIRQFFQLRNHIPKCHECDRITEKIINENPKNSIGPDPGIN